MKQQITTQQWDELSDDQNFAFWKTLDNSATGKIPNIGRMIEYLGDDWYNNIFSCISCGIIHQRYNNDKLCDALWEAVKYKLNQKEK